MIKKKMRSAWFEYVKSAALDVDFNPLLYKLTDDRRKKIFKIDTEDGRLDASFFAKVEKGKYKHMRIKN